MKYLAFISAAVIGLLVALFVGGLWTESSAPKPSGQRETNATRLEALHRHQRNADTALRESFASFDEGVTLADSALELSCRKVSPLRGHAFHRYRIENMSLDQIAHTLKLGRMTYRQDYTAAGERLAEEDPELAFELLFQRSRVESIDHFHAYLDAVIATGVRADAVGLLRRIQRLPRGGNKQATSLRFSRRWADGDPAKAAEFFDELVVLRSLKANDSIDYDESGFAIMIMTPWFKEDPDAARSYVSNLRSGQKKETLDAALSQLESQHTSKTD